MPSNDDSPPSRADWQRWPDRVPSMLAVGCVILVVAGAALALEAMLGGGAAAAVLAIPIAVCGGAAIALWMIAGQTA